MQAILHRADFKVNPLCNTATLQTRTATLNRASARATTATGAPTANVLAPVVAAFSTKPQSVGLRRSALTPRRAATIRHALRIVPWTHGLIGAIALSHVDTASRRDTVVWPTHHRTVERHVRSRRVRSGDATWPTALVFVFMLSSMTILIM